MAIRPHPTTYTCPACRWSKTVAPRSDALMPGEFFSACPVCRHAPLNRKAATLGEATLGGLADAHKRLWQERGLSPAISGSPFSLDKYLFAQRSSFTSSALQNLAVVV